MLRERRMPERSNLLLFPAEFPDPAVLPFPLLLPAELSLPFWGRG